MTDTQWGRGIHDRSLKEEICEIGRRVYDKGFAAANDGNISIRVGENEVLCSPTMICKGFMEPEDIFLTKERFDRFWFTGCGLGNDLNFIVFGQVINDDIEHEAIELCFR